MDRSGHTQTKRSLVSGAAERALEAVERRIWEKVSKLQSSKLYAEVVGAGSGERDHFPAVGRFLSFVHYAASN